MTRLLANRLLNHVTISIGVNYTADGLKPCATYCVGGSLPDENRSVSLFFTFTYEQEHNWF